MDVQLRISPEVTIRIDARAPDGTVHIRQYEGVDFEKPIHERQASSRLCLTKAQARTVASAIMGCAAEI